MAVAWTYAICVNFVPSYRDPADKIGDSDIGIVDAREDEEHKGSTAEVAVVTAGVKESR